MPATDSKIGIEEMLKNEGMVAAPPTEMEMLGNLYNIAAKYGYEKGIFPAQPLGPQREEISRFIQEKAKNKIMQKNDIKKYRELVGAVPLNNEGMEMIYNDSAIDHYAPENINSRGGTVSPDAAALFPVVDKRSIRR